MKQLVLSSGIDCKSESEYFGSNKEWPGSNRIYSEMKDGEKNPEMEQIWVICFEEIGRDLGKARWKT